MLKLITNIGYWKGGNGTGIIFVAITEDGKYAAVIKMLEGGVEVWKYLRKSQIQNGMSGGDILIASDFNLGLLLDTESPSFVVSSNAQYKTIETEDLEGAADGKRIYELEDPYTIKPANVFNSDISKLRTSEPTGTTGGNVSTGGTTTTGGSLNIIPTSFDGLFTNPIKFIQDNPLFFALVLGAVYFFRRKKKKPLWII